MVFSRKSLSTGSATIADITVRMAIEIAYARGVYDLCRKYDVLFIADEVRMGAGRTGKFFCHQWLGPDAKPDMICMGKSIAVSWE